MTAIFAVLEYRCADYEGGGHELYGVFSTKEKAFAYLEKLWKEYDYPPEKLVDNGFGSYVIDDRYGEHSFSIDELILDEEK